MKYQIEHGVPIPPTKTSRYPFAEMAVGDSFGSAEEPANTVRACAIAYAKKHHGKKFIVRSVEGGCRCWRTE